MKRDVRSKTTTGTRDPEHAGLDGFAAVGRIVRLDAADAVEAPTAEIDKGEALGNTWAVRSRGS